MARIRASSKISAKLRKDPLGEYARLMGISRKRAMGILNREGPVIRSIIGRAKADEAKERRTLTASRRKRPKRK